MGIQVSIPLYLEPIPLKSVHLPRFVDHNVDDLQRDIGNRTRVQKRAELADIVWFEKSLILQPCASLSIKVYTAAINDI